MPKAPKARHTTVLWFALWTNTAYLAAVATPSVFYYANVALHPLLGLAVLAAAFPLIRRGLRSPTASVAGPPVVLATLTGLLVLIGGATGANRRLLVWHVGAAVLALAVVGAVLMRVAWDERRTWWGRTVGVALGALLIASVVAGGAAMRHQQWRREASRIVNPPAPLSMDAEGRGPAGPFFPSSSDTTTGALVPTDFLLNSAACGRCHTEVYDQWRSSVHHLSSFNNQWYRKSIEYMQEVVGTRPSKWCAGCHDHAVFFNGRFDEPIKDQIDTPEAQAGLGCLSCHAVTRVKSTMGQGDFVVERPPLQSLASTESRLGRAVHDTLLALDPQPHRESLLKPFHREQTSEFCSACHKVHLDVPVNGYRWLRGFNDYDNWQASGVSGEGARSFYYPPEPRGCRDCHMPRVPSSDPAAKDGLIRSHRFAAANTALAFVNHDATQLRAVQDFLRDGQLSVDIFGLVRTGAATPVGPAGPAGEPQLSTTFAVGEESAGIGRVASTLREPDPVVGPLDRVEAVVRRGESVRVEVVVRTRKIGHFFPAGTVDAFDVWVEFEAVDDRGRTIVHSGFLEGDGGPVEPGAHFYRSLMLDEHGGVINKRNAWMTRSTAYVRLIPPGAADTVHFRLDIPEDAGDTIQLRAKVNYRKFSWWFTQWAYGGVRDPDHLGFSLGPGHDDGRWLFTGDVSGVSGAMKSIPNLPVTVMAEAATSLRVLPRQTAPPNDERPRDAAFRERWNDYGIGLLLQGDLKGAEAAFLAVTDMDPTYADGWVNVARARLDEGNTSGAHEALDKALALDPTLAKTHFFLGMVYKNLGRYDEARGHFERARAQYPRDRVVRNQLGRVLFLQRRFAEAIVEFHAALAVDPEDLQAHYNLMLCYRGLGDDAQAVRHETLYLRFKADEAAQAITGPYRQLNPHDNNERQPVHEHRAAPPGSRR
ncbi:MAG: tetratricopeptide repeat protein [Acidobacteriota bacterium]